MEKTKSKTRSSSEIAKNKLSILISQDGFCFCASDEDEIIAFYNEDFKTKQSPEELLRSLKSPRASAFLEKYRNHDISVEVFYANGLFTLVPLPYFKEENLSDYLKYTIKLLETDEIAFDTIEAAEANLVYIPYVNINNFLFDYFGEFTYHHIGGAFISNAISHADSIKPSSVFVEVYPSHFLLSAVGNNNLLICNDYEYQTPEDLVYYVLFTIVHLDLDNETLHLYLSGAIEESDESYESLRRYIRHVDFSKNISKPFSHSLPIKETTKQRFQLLLSTL